MRIHPRIEQLFALLDDSRAELRAAFESVPAAERTLRPGDERWSPAEVVHHVALVERRVAGRLAAAAADARANGALGEETDVSPLADLDPLAARLLDRSAPRAAPDVTHPPAGVSADDAWTAFEEAHAGFRATVTSLNGLALGTINMAHPALGSLTAYEWIAGMAGHERRHAAQILDRK